MKKWELEVKEIGYVISDFNLEVYKKDNLLAKIRLDSLCDGVPIKTYSSFVPENICKVSSFLKKEYKRILNLKKDWNQIVLDFLNKNSLLIKKVHIYEQFDYLIGTNTILKPEDSGASGLRIKKYPIKILCSLDGNSNYVHLNPKKGTFISIAESFRNIISAGGEVLCITNSINLGNILDKEIQNQLYNIIMGMEEICNFFNIPVISGNISLNNKTEDGNNIYPTPIIGAIGVNKTNESLITCHFKNEGDIIFLIGKTEDEIHGSSYLKTFYSNLSYKCPYFNMIKEKNIQETIKKLINLGLIESAIDLSEGGLIISLIRSCLNTNFGVSLYKNTLLNDSSFLFSESQSRFLISIKNIYEKRIVHFLENENIPFQNLGFVSKKEIIEINSLLYLNKKDIHTINEFSK